MHGIRRYFGRSSQEPQSSAAPASHDASQPRSAGARATGREVFERLVADHCRSARVGRLKAVLHVSTHYPDVRAAMLREANPNSAVDFEAVCLETV